MTLTKTQQQNQTTTYMDIFYLHTFISEGRQQRHSAYCGKLHGNQLNDTSIDKIMFKKKKQ